jgi:asparagine synthase (glutamine-hydrolysing)
MCGIAGGFSFEFSADPIDQTVVARLNDLQRRRGPDGSGLWSSDDKRIVLGHRRLAIIDTGEGGVQPMADATGRWVISFNGEIYNYRALRLELERMGCVFRTQSDTEVLINAVAQWGEGALCRLRGMFAFALWDGLHKELWLARDPYGIKPLYVAESQGTLWFASQGRALARCTPVDTKRDSAALTGFYLWGHVPEPFSWWAGIRAFPAGHVQRIRVGKARPQPKAFASIQDAYVGREAQPLAQGELRQLMLETVRDHMVSDVPVGIFLSAGIDSNVIAALAAELGTQLRTVTLAFDEYVGTPDDEAPLAEAAARLLRSDHVTVRIGRDDYDAIIEDFVESMDQPTIDGLNTYLVSRAAAMQGLKVALSGLGGDELFGGYPSFRQIPTLLKWGRRVPFSRSLSGAVRGTLRSLFVPGIPPKAAGLLSHSRDIGSAYLLRRALHLEDELDSLLDETLLKEGLDRLCPVQTIAESVSALRVANVTPYAQVAALESCWYLRNQLLRDTDWSSMAHGLEVRVPFVDMRLLERLGPVIASDAPPNKQDLAACAKKLPLSVLGRSKTGFSTPIRDWVDDQLGGSERGLRGWAKVVVEKFDAGLGPATRSFATRRPTKKLSRKQAGRIVATKPVRFRKETIIIFRIGSIGDTVIALPCFHRIASSFPNARRIVLTNKPVSLKAAPLESVLGDTGLIDGVIHFSPATRSVRELLELRERILETGARTLIYLSPRGWFGSIRDISFFRCCGIRRIIGVPLRRDLRNVRINQETGATEREAERLARCLAPLGSIDVRDDALWDLHLRPEEILASSEPLNQLRGANFMAINAGGKVSRKDWGDAHWTKLLRLMAPEYSEFALVLIGAADEFDRSEGIAVEWPGPKLNLCGELVPRMSAAVMQRAVLFIGHDSGPMHLAAAVGTPCVAMFGDFNPPAKWHPFGAHHRLIHDMRGVRNVSPEEVYAAVRLVLTARAEPATSEIAQPSSEINGLRSLRA